MGVKIWFDRVGAVVKGAVVGAIVTGMAFVLAAAFIPGIPALAVLGVGIVATAAMTILAPFGVQAGKGQADPGQGPAGYRDRKVSQRQRGAEVVAPSQHMDRGEPGGYLNRARAEATQTRETADQWIAQGRAEPSGAELVGAQRTAVASGHGGRG